MQLLAGAKWSHTNVTLHFLLLLILMIRVDVPAPLIPARGVSALALYCHWQKAAKGESTQRQRNEDRATYPHANLLPL